MAISSGEATSASLRSSVRAGRELAQRPAELAALSSPALDAMFRASSVVPSDFMAISGDPRGRVLAIPGVDRGLVGRAVASFQGSVLYPWEGKSFSAHGADHGMGVNRFRYPLRRGLFTFRTCFTSSLVDARPCIAIDYDVPENPRVARSIYDELRAIGDGLYLGRGMMRTAKNPRLVLWFLVDTNTHDAPLR